MVNSLPVIWGVGIVLGFLSGLGVGGGSLLMLWLTIVVDLEHEAARTINLLFFLPTAAIASFFRWKQGALDLKKIFPGILVGCISAGIFSWLSQQMDITIIKRLFGALLLITGSRELFYRERKPR